eukprot:1533497-Pyramimonas_sp.AAC.1
MTEEAQRFFAKEKRVMNDIRHLKYDDEDSFGNDMRYDCDWANLAKCMPSWLFLMVRSSLGRSQSCRIRSTTGTTWE